MIPDRFFITYHTTRETGGRTEWELRDGEALGFFWEADGRMAE